MPDRHPPIPIPDGGLTSNEAEARWLEQTILMRAKESLTNFGINAEFKPSGLYDLLLLSLNRASRRGRKNRETPNAQ
jgi:hypothetical protein